jgi:hypothetical protein
MEQLDDFLNESNLKPTKNASDPSEMMDNCIHISLARVAENAILLSQESASGNPKKHTMEKYFDEIERNLRFYLANKKE